MESLSDDQLLTASARDLAAFATFYLRYERAMLTYFLRRTGDAELSADLTAEVFAAAMLGCQRYRPGGAPAAAWLFGIAHNKLADSMRRGRVQDAARRRLRMAPVVWHLSRLRVCVRRRAVERQHERREQLSGAPDRPAPRPAAGRCGSGSLDVVCPAPAGRNVDRDPNHSSRRLPLTARRLRGTRYPRPRW